MSPDIRNVKNSIISAPSVEKTKALLFQGANGRSNGDAALPPAGSIRDNHSRVHSFDRDSSTKSHIARNNGSTETVSTGSREQTGLLDYFTSSGGATGGGGKSGVGGECSGCKGRQREVWSCAHCEGVMCGECSRQCLHCQGTFCSNCSVLK